MARPDVSSRLFRVGLLSRSFEAFQAAPRATMIATVTTPKSMKLKRLIERESRASAQLRPSGGPVNRRAEMWSTLTTTHANDLIILGVQGNAAAVNSVTDTAGLTWIQIGTRVNTISVFYAIAPSILISDSITVNYSSTVGFDAVQAAAFSGVNTSTPLDSNGALPGTTTSASPLSLTTSNGFDLLFAVYALNGAASAGSGWTAVPGTGATGFDLFEYQIVNAAQSATAANTSNNTQIKCGIGSAIVSL